jgi:hypothetical protein
MLNLGLLVLGASLQQHRGYGLYAGPFGVGVHVHARQYSQRITALVHLLHGAHLHVVGKQSGQKKPEREGTNSGGTSPYLQLRCTHRQGPQRDIQTPPENWITVPAMCCEERMLRDASEYKVGHTH